MPTLLMITPENQEIKRFRAKQTNNFSQLTMPYLAGFVPSQFEITLVDEYNQAVPDRHFDLVAITVNTPNAPHIYAMAKKFRARGAWVVLGGPHVTLLSEEAGLHADTIFVGEAEETWPRFLQDFLEHNPKPVYTCQSPPSLTGLPLPRRDLVHRHWLTKGAVFASRGCPHTCSYCCLKQIYCPQFRTRPLKEVVVDIASIPNRHFVFWDDNFFAQPEYTKALLKELIPLKKRWAAQVTAHSCLDEELLALARQAGCLYLFLGLESFSTAGLQHANKSFNPLQNYAKIIDLIHHHGISIQAGIVFGFDSDTEQTFGDTLQICEELGLDGATVSLLTPFPGTELYRQFQQQNRLLPVDWSYYNGKTRVAFQPQQLTPEQLLAGYHSFRRRFFSWPSIFKRLSKSKTNLGYNLIMNWGYQQADHSFKRL